MSRLKRVSIDVSHVLFGIGNLTKIEKSQHKGIENREHMRSGPLANLASIFGQSPIATVMQTIFDGPVLPLQFQQTRGVSLFGGEAGDPIDHLLRAFEGMLHSLA